MERLLAMAERMETRDAEKQFAAAFVELQTAIPTIQGARPIPDKSGNVKFRYANFDDIDAIVKPLCLKHGFTYSFHEGAIVEGRVTVIMTLTHRGGHSRQIPYSCRIGNGPPGANESQADGSGHSYAQRGAIESGLALRIVGGVSSDDARSLGGMVTQEHADELRRRAKACGANETNLLAYLTAATYELVPSARYEDGITQIEKKEAKNKTAPTQRMTDEELKKAPDREF
jgi:hypothetical protein